MNFYGIGTLLKLNSKELTGTQPWIPGKFAASLALVRTLITAVTNPPTTEFLERCETTQVDHIFITYTCVNTHKK